MNPIPCWPVDDTHRVTHYPPCAELQQLDDTRLSGAQSLAMWFGAWPLEDAEEGSTAGVSAIPPRPAPRFSASVPASGNATDK